MPIWSGDFLRIWCTTYTFPESNMNIAPENRFRVPKRKLVFYISHFQVLFENFREYIHLSKIIRIALRLFPRKTVVFWKYTKFWDAIGDAMTSSPLVGCFCCRGKKPNWLLISCPKNPSDFRSDSIKRASPREDGFLWVALPHEPVSEKKIYGQQVEFHCWNMRRTWITCLV